MVHKKYYRKPPKINLQKEGVSFELSVDYFLNSDLHLKIFIKDRDAEKIKTLSKAVLSFVDNWNKKPNERKIHNVGIRHKDNLFIHFQFDFGLVSIDTLKKLLLTLNQFNFIKVIKIGSFYR